MGKAAAVSDAHTTTSSTVSGLGRARGAISSVVVAAAGKVLQGAVGIGAWRQQSRGSWRRSLSRNMTRLRGFFLSVKRRKEPSLILRGRNRREGATRESPHCWRKEPPLTPQATRLEQCQILSDRKVQDTSIRNGSDDTAARSASSHRYSRVGASGLSPGESASRSPVPFPCSGTRGLCELGFVAYFGILLKEVHEKHVTRGLERE